MKTIAKPLVAAAALLAIVMIPGCGGPKGPPTAGGNTASAAGAAGSGTDTAGSGTGTGGNNLAQTPTAPGTSPPDTETTASAVSNTVILGPQFVGIPAASFHAKPGQSETQSFELDNMSGQPVTVGSIKAVPALVVGASPNAADTAAFTPGTECNDRTLDLGSSCTFTVTFRPTESRHYSAYLDLDVTPSASGSGFALEGHAEPGPGPGQDTSPPASQLAPAEPAPSGPAPSEPAPAGGSSP